MLCTSFCRTANVAALSVFAGAVIIFEGVFAVGALIDRCLSAGLQRYFVVNAHLTPPAVDDAVLLPALVADPLRALLLGEVIVAGGAAAVGALAVFKINLAVRAINRLIETESWSIEGPSTMWTGHVLSPCFA